MPYITLKNALKLMPSSPSANPETIALAALSEIGSPNFLEQGSLSRYERRRKRI